MSDSGIVQRCTTCGADLAPDESGLCTTCSIELAEGAATASSAATVERNAKSTRDPAKRAARKRLIELFVIVVCLAVIAWRVPAFVEAVAPEAPVRIGPYTTSGSCDACVANLWEISTLLTAEKSIPASFMCPSMDVAYVVEKRGDVTVVSCPNPEKHGLSSLSVSDDRPIPTAVAR